MIDRSEDLIKILKNLIIQEPFYGLLALKVSKEWTANKKEAGININKLSYILRIHEDFWDSADAAEKAVIVKHELLHLAFQHWEHYTRFPDKELFNIAADLVVNQYLENVPKRWITVDKLPNSAGIQRNQGVDYYYDLLKKIQSEQPEKAQGLSALFESQHSTHEGLEDTSQLDEASKRLLDNSTKETIREVYEETKKSRGNIPAFFEEIYKKIIVEEPSVFDWRAYLRRFAGNSQKVYTKKLKRKYNKRFEEYSGLKIKQKKHVLVVIDTSGSVSAEELKEFMKEIHHIYKTGSEVTILQCDTTIKSVKPYDGKSDIKIVGRGGTSFDPPVQYYNENHKKFSCMVYLTDGECSPPQDNPRGKILWVHSSKSRINEELPGFKIKLN